MAVTIDDSPVEAGDLILVESNATTGQTVKFTPSGLSGYTCTWVVDGTQQTATVDANNALTLDTTGWTRGLYDVQLTAVKGSGSTAVYESYHTQIRVEVLLVIKPAPDAVGDIVFNDGTAVAYFNGIYLPPKMRAKAIAIIFYKGTECSNDSSSRLLGIGLSIDTTRKKTWCTSSANGSNKAINSLLCMSSGDSLTFVSNADKDGHDNFSQLKSACSDAETEGRYPAFQWAQNYSSTVSNLSGTTYETGWFLPTTCELIKVYEQKETIDAISDVLGGESLGDFKSSGTGGYWSASTMQNENDRAAELCCSYSSSTEIWRLLVNNNTKTSQKNVCAIHEF